jgi:hypothetical protein
MADEPEANVAAQLLKAATPSSGKKTDGEKLTSAWMIPLITAVAMAIGFCAYYFIYVGSRREHIANRNFRALALLGEQLQQRISVHANILKLVDDLLKGASEEGGHRKMAGWKDYLLVHEEDANRKDAAKKREALMDYVKYLAPTLDVTVISGKVTGSEPRLQVQRHNDRWELVLAALPEREKNGTFYRGDLRIDELMEPLVGSLPFDDVLLVSTDGTIVYQSKQTGPRFTTLNSLLKTQVAAAVSKPAGKSDEPETQAGEGTKSKEAKPELAISRNVDPAWRANSPHLTDVVLAGIPYKLFLQPVLVSSFSGEKQVEPATEWVLGGLRSSSALDWEALSLSFTFFIWFTMVLFVVWTSYKILKIFLMNHRERLRLRELGTVGLSVVLLCCVLTLTLVQWDFRRKDDTDTRLEHIANAMSGNIHDELKRMMAQLTNWCGNGYLKHDLASVAGDSSEFIRRNTDDHNLKGSPVAQTPKADIYPYANNAFWTDDDGHQIVKWSTTRNVTPMIDVAELSINASPDMRLDGGGSEFHFSSILPPNKLEYLATLSIKTEACTNGSLVTRDPRDSKKPGAKPVLEGRKDITDGHAFLTVQPFSLIDPILPHGFGFAVVDQAGTVLFHSDKTRNGRENFLVEADGNRELYASLFNHSSRGAISLKYTGTDHRAIVVPLQGISQTPWSLIVYRDLTSVRTLNLQVMAITATFLVLALAVPILLVAAWTVIQRHRFAPEWVWPNRRRLRAYLRLIRGYAILIALFLVSGFRGPTGWIVVASVLAPCAALCVTVWCFWRYPADTRRLRLRRGTASLAASAAAGAVLVALALGWASGRVSGLLLVPGFAAGVSMLSGPREYLTGRWRAASGRAQRRLPDYKDCYLACVLLLLLLIGVLTPMALYRASLDVEWRLGIKQAQRHLATALARRWRSIRDQRDKDELSDGAWGRFNPGEHAGNGDPEAPKPGPPAEGKLEPWSWIVPVELLPDGKSFAVAPHADAKGELYSAFLQSFVYNFHHDYNDSSAEMLGVLADKGNPPDWSWEDANSQVKLRWHAGHPPHSGPTGAAEPNPHDDLIIATDVSSFSLIDAAVYTLIAGAVMLIICPLLWGLTRRLFRFDIEPLKMTGTRLVAELLRDGKNVLALLPPVSKWRLDEPKWILDVAKIAKAPKWAEVFDLTAVPFNTVIELPHFEFSTGDPEIDNQKLVLLQRLISRENTQIAVLLTVPASTEDYRRTYPFLEAVDLREEPFPWLEQYAGPAQHHIFRECTPMPALWPLGAQLARDIREMGGERVYTAGTIASEILERADPYYRLIWKECTNDQRFVLSQLAEDGLLNPANGRATRQLIRRGLIVKDPQFRIMNESFRRFLRSVTTTHLKRDWVQDSRRSGWGKAHGAIFTVMVLLGVFLLATQNALWQSAAAYVTTALGALGTLSKLSDSVRGKGGGTAKPE